MAVQLFSLFIHVLSVLYSAGQCSKNIGIPGQNAPALTVSLAHFITTSSPSTSLVVVARGDGHGHVGEALGGLVHVHVRAVGDGVEQLVARHLRTRGLGGQGQG